MFDDDAGDEDKRMWSTTVYVITVDLTACLLLELMPCIGCIPVLQSDSFNMTGECLISALMPRIYLESI